MRRIRFTVNGARKVAEIEPRLLLAHLVLFGFVYPAERRGVPEAAMSELLARIPVHVVMNPNVAVLGAAAVAARI